MQITITFSYPELTLFSILTDVSQIVYKDTLPKINNGLVNDTLNNLLEIEYLELEVSDEKAKENFNYLVDIGMHSSAYNLLYEKYSYRNIKWDIENLEKG